MERLHRKLFSYPLSIHTTEASIPFIVAIRRQIQIERLNTGIQLEDPQLKQLLAFLVNTARMIKLFRKYLDEELIQFNQIIGIWGEFAKDSTSMQGDFEALNRSMMILASLIETTDKTPAGPAVKYLNGQLFLSIPFKRDIVLHLTHGLLDYLRSGSFTSANTLQVNYRLHWRSDNFPEDER
ncbi:hypothetical protein M422DRAFT_23506 [Sphaerobolus stellatus SS14]|nr:hypothetical protein M422DRAFT_23506 [Sphaerobolus stellatus SS14]